MLSDFQPIQVIEPGINGVDVKKPSPGRRGGEASVHDAFVGNRHPLTIELHPEEDLQRMTASVMYNRPLAKGNWASTLLWGRNRSLSTGLVWNGYLAESTLRFAERNYVWGRFENVDRTNELLLKNQLEPPNFEESIIGRVQAYTAGYERDFDLVPHLATGLGAPLTLYSTPGTLGSKYGNHPVGAVVFLRVRPFGKRR